MTFRWWLYLSLSLSLSSLLVVSTTDAAGIQSGPSAGNSYAGGMFYDGNNNMIYVTGQTYDTAFTSTATDTLGIHCFVAAVDLSQWSWDDAGVLLGDNATATTTCQAIGYLAPSTLIVGGDSEPGGLPYSPTTTGTSVAVMTGFISLLDRAQITKPLDTLLLQPNDSSSAAPRVEYPQFLVTTQNNAIFTISLDSWDDRNNAPNPSGTTAPSSSSPNTDIAAQYPNYMTLLKYGSSFDMAVRKLSLQQAEFLGIPEGPMTLQMDWSKQFAIQSASPTASATTPPPRVYVGGVMVKNGQALVVAGSTRGHGVGYGPAQGSDEDGYVTVLSMDTGDLYPINSPDSTIQKNNVRIGTAANDVVMGICDDPQDVKAFYVVGATAGQMDPQSNALSAPSGSLQAFVSKLDIDTLRTTWSRQWGARMSATDTTTVTGAFAAGCSVYGNTLYIAGGVEDGAAMINDQTVLTSQGGNDLFVVSLNTNDATTNWMQQVGTSGSDQLSRHNGVQADDYGNVILYGDTNGSMYRDRSSSDATSDVFVMILTQDSGSVATMGQPVSAPTNPPIAPTAAPITLPTPVPATFTAMGAQLPGPLSTGAMVYDGRHNQAWFTGTSYGGSAGRQRQRQRRALSSGSSQCFVASLDLDTGRIIAPNAFGSAGVNETCSALSYSSLEDLAYIAGGSPKDGFLVQDAAVNPTTTNPNTVQFGFLMQVEAENIKLIGGGVNQQNIVQYPIAIVTDPQDDILYVASMGSNSSQPYSVPQSDMPEAAAAFGSNRPYGANFFTAVQRYRVTTTDPNGQTPKKVFNEEFYQSYAIDQQNENVLTSGMTLAGNGNTLIVVGSTRGSGGPFGSANPNGDMDGFILKLDPTTGQLQSAGGQRSSTRLDSINQKDDWVMNVCNDRFDNDAFYVVGASQGKVRGLSDSQQPPAGTTHAFIAKVSVESLTAQWLQHFTMQAPSSGGTAQASALACAVTTQGNGNNLVYVAGGIQGGATMDNAVKTPGAAKDDIFVAQLDGGNGTLQWIQQVGTSENDQLAQEGGLDVDGNGNAIVYAQTAGSFFSQRSSTASSSTMDLVVFTMDKKDGSYKELAQNGGSTQQGTEAPQNNPAVLGDTITAIQTGPDVGPTYAGGMYYDAFSNSIYVTGATYGNFGGSTNGQASNTSSCIFGALTLPKLEWMDMEIYGTANAPEACSAVSMTSYQDNNAAIVIGSTEKGGLLTQLATSGVPATQYGIALDLASVNGKYVLQGGAAMDQNVVQFPISLQADDNGMAWIVSMVSDNTKVTASYDKASTKEYPNFTTGGIEKYGSNYRVVLERYEVLRSGQSEQDGVLESSLQIDWRKPFETTNQESIFVSDMIRVNNGNTLVIVGSTKSSGISSDMDGIMAKVDPENGNFQSGGKGTRSMAHFASVKARDDWILGACRDPDDEMSFYVVGATQGKIGLDAKRNRNDVTVHAIVAKIQVNKLATTWVKQFPVTHAGGSDTKPAAASALGCDVIPGAGAMYIAGTVENGATIDQGNQKSAGRDDIFVAKLSTKDGNVAWMKQVGSNGDDRVARGEGVKVDANGNAVVFGDTNGSFFRDRSNDGSTKLYSDLFTMIFNQADGAHIEPLVAPPIQGLPPDTSMPPEWYPNGLAYNRTTLKVLSFVIIALGVAALFFCFICFGRRRARRRAESQKSSIFAYLQQFDVEDIDLRRSPPGGWHGTYRHKLAYGINKAAKVSEGGFTDVTPSPRELAPLTHSSFVRDSLFMETSSAPSLGYCDDDELHGLDEGYDDLEPRTYEERSKNLKEIV